MKPITLSRRARLVAAALILVLAAAAAVTLRRPAGGGAAAPSAAAVYYCPMHPTYTSDRPGDCPICNMKLVKKEAEPSALARPPAGAAKSAHDICYLHNCPHARQGQPCPMTVVAKEGEAVVCPICGAHVADAASRLRKVLYWTDPMLPGYKSDKPGQSPMGMELVPVYEEGGPEAAATSEAPEGYAPILVAPQKRQLIGVTTARVERRSITRVIRTVGQIANDPALYQAQQEYLQAQRALSQAAAGAAPEIVEQARQLVEASQVRLRRMGLSPELIREIDGQAGPDQSLILADPDGRVWLYAQIYEFELPLVAVGQAVTVEVQAIPGLTLEGAIKAIDPVLDPVTRAARIRAILTDPQHVLKPDMFVNASIRVTADDVLAAPESAVFDTGTRKIVFVDKGQGLFEPRDVTVGVKADGYDEITAGVTAGEQVVTSGNFLIDSESRLKAALQGMSPSAGSGQGDKGHQHGQ